MLNTETTVEVAVVLTVFVAVIWFFESKIHPSTSLANVFAVAASPFAPTCSLT